MNDDKEQIMKKIAILLTAILFAGILSAQNSTQSRTILDKAFAAYEKSKGVSLRSVLPRSKQTDKATPLNREKQWRNITNSNSKCPTWKHGSMEKHNGCG
jgi:hypothetical protein